MLVSKADAGRPLWLSVACEELRVFGDFRRLDEKIEDLSPELIGLLEQVLQRTVKDNGGDLVIATLCLIQVSKLGLLETELLELLAMTPTLPGSSSSSNQHQPLQRKATIHGTDVTSVMASLPMAQVRINVTQIFSRFSKTIRAIMMIFIHILCSGPRCTLVCGRSFGLLEVQVKVV